MQPLNNGSVPPKSWFSRSTTDNVLNALPGKTPEQQTKLVRGLLQHLIDNPKSDTLARLKQVADICPEILKSELRYRVSHAPQQNSPVVAVFRTFLNETSEKVSPNPVTTAVSAPPPTITRVNPDRLKTGSGDSNDYAASAPPRSTSSTGISQSVPYRADSPVYNPNEDDSDIFGDSSRISNRDGIVAVSIEDVWAETDASGFEIPNDSPLRSWGQVFLDLNLNNKDSDSKDEIAPIGTSDIRNPNEDDSYSDIRNPNEDDGDIDSKDEIAPIGTSDIRNPNEDDSYSDIRNPNEDDGDIDSKDEIMSIGAMWYGNDSHPSFRDFTLPDSNAGIRNANDGDIVSAKGEIMPIAAIQAQGNVVLVDAIVDEISTQVRAKILALSSEVTGASLMKLHDSFMEPVWGDHSSNVAIEVEVRLFSLVALSLNVTIDIPAATDRYFVDEFYLRMAAKYDIHSSSKNGG
jgi:hypothetical protein